MKKAIELLQDVRPEKGMQSAQKKIYELEKDIETTSLRLEESLSIEEFNECEKEIGKLKEELNQTRIELQWLPKIKSRMAKEKSKEIKKTYNEEFQDIYERYTQLDKSLKKEINSFALRIEPLVTEMQKLEDRETSYRHLFFGLPIDQSSLIRLPIEKQKIEANRGWFAPMTYSLANSLFVLLGSMKRVGNNEK